jgi:allantoin racemase
VKISYVIPGPMSQGPLGPGELLRRQEILRRWAAPDVEIDVRECPHGPASIESAYEEYLAVAGLVAALTELEQEQQADAAIVGCFGDPGLDALYEVTAELPVVGPGEASMHFAAMLGSRFAVITVTDGVVGPIERMAARAGLGGRLLSVAVVDTPVLALQQDPERTAARAGTAGRELVRQGATVLILGCMSMAFLDLGPALEAELGVPVVNPVQAALAVAEGRARFRMRHSKTAYPAPSRLE